MRPLETEDAQWVSDIAKLLAEVLHLAEHIDRELLQEVAPRGSRSDRYGPGYFHTRGSPYPYDRNQHIETRYTRDVRRARELANEFLRVYDKKLG